MRTLAVDLGQRRVGLALSDEGGKFATPYEVVEVSSAAAALERVGAVIASEGVTRVVLGLPINMDDSMGPAAKGVIAWGKQLAEKSAVPVVYVDERLSSFSAEQNLNARKRAGEKLTRKRRNSQLDALAAAMFLQEFLDGKLVAIDMSER